MTDSKWPRKQGPFLFLPGRGTFSTLQMGYPPKPFKSSNFFLNLPNP